MNYQISIFLIVKLLFMSYTLAVFLVVEFLFLDNLVFIFEVIISMFLKNFLSVGLPVFSVVTGRVFFVLALVSLFSSFSLQIGGCFDFIFSIESSTITLFH